MSLRFFGFMSSFSGGRMRFLSLIVSFECVIFYLLSGRAEWLDKGHRKCLILWHRIQDWADIVLQFVSHM